jgi:hypothetical protein
METILYLSDHLLPELAGGFIAYWIHTGHHRVFALVLKHRTGETPHR